MNPNPPKGLAVTRLTDATKRVVACPRCGEYNDGGATRCRDCLTNFSEPLGTKPPPKAAAAIPVRALPAAARPVIVRKRKAAAVSGPVRPRVSSRTVAAPAPNLPNLDALWSELEALTRSDELGWFQCPVCSNFVDGTATRCACGALFEEPKDSVSYACPVCNAPVAASSVRCQCGARFSD